MLFNLKKSLCTSAALLMMLSTAVPAVSANGQTQSNHNSTRTQRIIHHINTHRANENRLSHLKQIRANNVKRFNRIRNHILNHQKNLQKIAQRLHRVQRHPRQHNAKYVNMINRLNNDKARLISVIENNQHGMLRLARQVNTERHAIDIIKHPGTAKKAVKQPALASNPQQSYYNETKGAFYRNDNGTVNQGTEKTTNDNGRISGNATLNGKEYPLNSNVFDHLHDDFTQSMNQIQTFDQQMNHFDQQINSEIQNDITTDFGNSGF